MYPEGHPSLGPSAENTLERLSDLLEDRPVLSIGVARNRLVIEGVATDPKHPVVGHLARRLHDHQLAAITIARGAQVPEIRGLLESLASESHREGLPLGLLPRDELPTWDHVKLFPVGYDQLELEGAPSSGEEVGRVNELWSGLVQAALTQDESSGSAESVDTGTMARSISEGERAEAQTQMIAGYLADLTDQLKEARGGDVEVVRRSVSSLVEEVDEGTLRRLVELGGDEERRKKFLADANKSLGAKAVSRVLTATAEASSRPISGSLTRLVSKMALQAESGSDAVRNQADAALREIVEELMAGWELEDPNPGQYTMVLDAMASSNPIFRGTGEHGAEDDGEPERRGAGRVMVMAMEIDATGPIVERAVSELVSRGHLVWALEKLEEAPSGNHMAEHFVASLTTPDHLKSLLSEPEVDEDILDYMVRQSGPPAVDVLLEALSESEHRTVRRRVFDCLANLDTDRFPVAQKAAQMIGGSRWYVKRNMLRLLRELDVVPPGFSALPYMNHTDARVRLEAFPVAFHNEIDRDEAVERALVDPDERLVRMALVSIQEGGLTNQAARIVFERFIKEEQMPDLRGLAVRALRASRAPAACEALLEVALGRRGFLGRRKLAETSSELLVALEGLADNWRGNPDARRALKLAKKSKDPDVRAAAGDEGES